MNGKNAKLIRKFVGIAKEKELISIGLNLDEAIQSPQKFLKKRFKALRQYEREEFKTRMKLIISK